MKNFRISARARYLDLARLFPRWQLEEGLGGAQLIAESWLTVS